MDADLPQVFAQSGAEASHNSGRHFGSPVSRTEVVVFSPEYFRSGGFQSSAWLLFSGFGSI